MALFQSHSYTLPWRSVKGRSSTQVPRPRILPRQLHSGGFSTADSKGVVAVGVGLASVTLRRKGRTCSVAWRKMVDDGGFPESWQFLFAFYNMFYNMFSWRK
jgi:hypothetical protein